LPRFPHLETYRHLETTFPRKSVVTPVPEQCIAEVEGWRGSGSAMRCSASPPDLVLLAAIFVELLFADASDVQAVGTDLR